MGFFVGCEMLMEVVADTIGIEGSNKTVFVAVGASSLFLFITVVTLKIFHLLYKRWRNKKARAESLESICDRFQLRRADSSTFSIGGKSFRANPSIKSLNFGEPNFKRGPTPFGSIRASMRSMRDCVRDNLYPDLRRFASVPSLQAMPVLPSAPKNDSFCGSQKTLYHDAELGSPQPTTPFGSLRSILKVVSSRC